jgi:hypothetical protein
MRNRRVNTLLFAKNPLALALSGVIGGVLPNDMSYINRPAAVTNTQFTNSMAVYSGLLNITTGGSYSFLYAADDYEQIVIDRN